MQFLSDLITELPQAKVLQVTVGLFWTAVELDLAGEHRCGLAATLANPEFEHARLPAVERAGWLDSLSSDELLQGISSKSYTEVSIALAALNALLPPVQNAVDLPAEDLIARLGSDSSVALIGHFPFVKKLYQQVKQLWVLELNPQEDDLPAEAAPEIIPQADILAITATTLINHTFEDVFRHRRQDAKVLLLGPSTPLSPRLFDYGIDVLSGSIVTDPQRVVPLVRQGATFRQIRGHGVRLVTLQSPGLMAID